jgi:hypothetical protein
MIKVNNIALLECTTILLANTINQSIKTTKISRMSRMRERRDIKFKKISNLISSFFGSRRGGVA